MRYQRLSYAGSVRTKWKQNTSITGLVKSGKKYRIPIHEANNTVFFDANAQLLDKSDARFASVLTPYSEDGYKELVHNLTGQDMDDIVRTKRNNGIP